MRQNVPGLAFFNFSSKKLTFFRRNLLLIRSPLFSSRRTLTCLSSSSWAVSLFSTEIKNYSFSPFFYDLHWCLTMDSLSLVSCFCNFSSSFRISATNSRSFSSSDIRFCHDLLELSPTFFFFEAIFSFSSLFLDTFFLKNELHMATQGVFILLLGSKKVFSVKKKPTPALSLTDCQNYN